MSTIRFTADQMTDSQSNNHKVLNVKMLKLCNVEIVKVTVFCTGEYCWEDDEGSGHRGGARDQGGIFASNQPSPTCPPFMSLLCRPFLHPLPLKS